MKLVCPACGAQHQVSRVQDSYQELPCRQCGAPIPLTRDNLLDTGALATPKPAPAAAASVASAAPSAAAAPRTTPARITPDPPSRPPARAPDPEAPPRESPPPAPARPVAPDRNSGAQVTCAACGSRFDAARSSCPTCFRPRAEKPLAREATERCPKCGAGVARDLLACPECLHLLRDPVGSGASMPSGLWIGLAVALAVIGVVAIALWWRSVH